MAEHNTLGSHGEALAVEHLLQNGYTIRARNYRFDRAEIDIIAQKGTLLVVVEVKTRTSKFYGNPQDFVTPKQIQQLVKAVNEYMQVHQLDLEVRFDIIAIVKQSKRTEIEHLENAFYHF